MISRNFIRLRLAWLPCNSNRDGRNLEGRIDKLYTPKYGEAQFIPQKILDNIEIQEIGSMWLGTLDTVMTPTKAGQTIAAWERHTRPDGNVAESISSGQSDIQEHFSEVFSKYGHVNISTSTGMISQHEPWYLGMAFPYTLPHAVGGYDQPGKLCWCRPEHQTSVGGKYCLYRM